MVYTSITLSIRIDNYPDVVALYYYNEPTMWTPISNLYDIAVAKTD